MLVLFRVRAGAPMTRFLRAQLLLASAATCLMAFGASSQEVMKAGIGTRVAAVKQVRPAGPAAMPSDAMTQSDAMLAPAGRDTVAVKIDHAKVVRLPER